MNRIALVVAMLAVGLGLGASALADGHDSASGPSPARTSASAPAGALKLPADPRIAALEPDMRTALQGELGGTIERMCAQTNYTAPIYECQCYSDHIIKAQLDMGLKWAAAPGRMVLEPQIASVMPHVKDVHECINAAAIPKYAHEKAVGILGSYPSAKNKAIAQCVTDRVPADFKAKPGPDLSYIDSLVSVAYRDCSASFDQGKLSDKP